MNNEEASYLIFGGSSGLGFECTKKLLSLGKIVLVLSRTAPFELSKIHKLTHVPIDLTMDNSETYREILMNNSPIAGLIFSQRYRALPSIQTTDPKIFSNILNEFATSVISTGLVLDNLLELLNQNMIQSSPYSHIPIVIIGSTYSNSVGFDQTWQYHASKSALQSLVRYYASKGGRHLAINSINPPTFIKPKVSTHSESFLKKLRIWASLPAQSLDTVDSIADVCLKLLLEESNLISGNEIRLDHGTGYLYPDQIHSSE